MILRALLLIYEYNVELILLISYKI